MYVRKFRYECDSRLTVIPAVRSFTPQRYKFARGATRAPRVRAVAALSMSAFHHLPEAQALALGGVPMAFLRNETSHSRRDSAPSARQPRRGHSVTV